MQAQAHGPRTQANTHKMLAYVTVQAFYAGICLTLYYKSA